MPTEPIILFGGGGHARVVADAWLKSGVHGSDLVVFDDDPARAGREVVPGVRVASGRLDRATLAGRAFHIAIGSNRTRETLLREFACHAGRSQTVVHPAATLATGAAIAGGCFIAARAVVGPAAIIAEGVILNHGCVVDHDCIVGPATHIAPGAILGGGVVIGARVLVGAGAVVLPGLRVADDAVIGAGAIVTKDVLAHRTVAGVPARTLP